MTQTKFHPSRLQHVDANGDPIIGSLEFYRTGTSTKITTYADANRSTANPNPINANSLGIFGPIFIAPSDLAAGVKVSFFDASGGSTGSGSIVYSDDPYDFNSPLEWTDLSSILTQTKIGEVFYPRTNEEASSGIFAYAPGNAAGSIVNPQYRPGDVRRYGTNTTPGTTDMAPAIQAAINQMQGGGSSVEFDSTQVHYIATGLTWTGTGTTIHGNGARIVHSNDITPLTIGQLGSGNSMARSRLLGGLDFECTGTSTKPAVQMNQCIECEIHIVGTLGYDKGIYLTSESSGCAYNEIHFDRIKNSTTYGIHLYGDTGYVNENKFYCGRFTNVGSGYDWHVYIDKDASSSYPPNHNTFYSPCFEMSAGSDMDGYIYDNGQFNTYFEPRLELGGSETIDEARIRFGTGSKWNSVYGGYNFDGASIDDLGEKNRWFMRDQIRLNAGNPAAAYSIFHGMRAQINDNSNPACLIEDLYGTNSSGDAQVFKARARRNGTGGYFYDAERAGSMVIGLDDGFTYECILSHTSSATDRPGVSTPTANWATYWRKLNTKDGGAAWVTSTAYSQPVTQFRVGSDAVVLLNNSVTVRTGTGTPEAAVTAPIGSLYLRIDGSTSTTLYVKTSGTGNTGWTAK